MANEKRPEGRASLKVRGIALDLGGHKARRVGASYVTCCPVHDEKHPSLSLTEVKDKVLAHCHAGCPQVAVVAH